MPSCKNVSFNFYCYICFARWFWAKPKYGSLPKVWWDKTAWLVSCELGSSSHGGSLVPNSESQKSHYQNKMGTCAKNIPILAWYNILWDLYNTCTSTLIKLASHIINYKWLLLSILTVLLIFSFFREKTKPSFSKSNGMNFIICMSHFYSHTLLHWPLHVLKLEEQILQYQPWTMKLLQWFKILAFHNRVWKYSISTNNNFMKHSR